MFSEKDPFPRELCAGVVHKFLCAGCIACLMSVKLPDIFPCAYMSTFTVIGPRTFLTISKIPNIAALYALITVLTS